MKILKKIDEWFEKIFSTVATVMLICLILIVFISVMTRFVFKVSTGNIADLPPYLMIWLVFIGAIFATKNGTHIRIDLIDSIVKNATVLSFINAFVHLIAGVAFILVAKDSVAYIVMTAGFGNMEPALSIPYWILYSVIGFNFIFTALYYLINCIKDIRKGILSCKHS